jgi:hypothetical protein
MGMGLPAPIPKGYVERAAELVWDVQNAGSGESDPHVDRKESNQVENLERPVHFFNEERRLFSNAP